MTISCAGSIVASIPAFQRVFEKTVAEKISDFFFKQNTEESRGSGFESRPAHIFKMDEEKRQKDKEKAILLALKNNMALIRRDLEIHGMKKDGSTIFISKSKNYNSLWSDALKTLKKK